MKHLYQDDEGEGMVRRLLRSEWSFWMGFFPPVLVIITFFWNISVNQLNIENKVDALHTEITALKESINKTTVLREKQIENIYAKLDEFDEECRELNKQMAVVWERIFNKTM
jgi:hypothetical protein